MYQNVSEMVLENILKAEVGTTRRVVSTGRRELRETRPVASVQEQLTTKNITFEPIDCLQKEVDKVFIDT